MPFSPWPARAWRACCALRAVVRRRFLQWFRSLRPAQTLVLGFLSYAVAGVLLLSLPWAQRQPVGVLDNLFNVVSAVSTTGLTTISVADSYTFFGQFVLVCLFQLGGIGYMTVSSFIILARGRPLSGTRVGILRAEFTLPEGLDLQAFIRQVVLFTLAIEALGTTILYAAFAKADVESPLWSAVFHCVSAFATAGFSLYNDSLERFRDDPVVCATIGALAYLGAIGFIVIQDAWRAARSGERRITFTSQVILSMTAMIFVVGSAVLYFVDGSLQNLPPVERWGAAAFQVMTASSTAGFNTVPIADLSAATLTLITVVMIIGASPSGTGGGIKTTTLSSLLAVLSSVARGRSRVLFKGREIPVARVLTAVASTTFYLAFLTLGVFFLCLAESHEFLSIVFEAASALGTVGLSLGITGDLTPAGKTLVTLLMFVGRTGPLTIGLALFRQSGASTNSNKADLAV
jgi:trk system potassium uptake protein